MGGFVGKFEIFYCKAPFIRSAGKKKEKTIDCCAGSGVECKSADQYQWSGRKRRLYISHVEGNEVVLMTFMESLQPVTSLLFF